MSVSPNVSCRSVCEEKGREWRAMGLIKRVCFTYFRYVLTKFIVGP